LTSRTVACGGYHVTITGFAKGAAMIGPNMATMLAFLLTDASISTGDLASVIARATACSFNAISVEGHTSTNDSAIFLANGTGPALNGHDLARFSEGAIAVCDDLARAIAADAEGASHLITINVEGTRTEAEASCIARAIANSPLVKAAFFGADPNWGRIVSAAGYAGVDFKEEQLSLWIGKFLIYERGAPVPFDAANVSAYIRENRDLTVRLLLTLGTARCTFFTCDLTTEYVRLNADYTT